MRILATNDDGVYAPGILALVEALSPEHQVFVVAPEAEQSAVGHSITLADPIRVRPLDQGRLSGFAITGTPADCVKLAVHEFLDEPPDLVVSGINRGANVGVNLVYSGTVSAATEAAMMGLSSIAFSLDSHDPKADYGPAAQVASRIVGQYSSMGLPAGVALIVNVPATPLNDIRGLKITRQSTAKLRERFLKRTDPRGHVYYWQAGETMGTDGGMDTDYPALLAGYVTMTPIRFDLTHHGELVRLAGWQGRWP